MMARAASQDPFRQRDMDRLLAVILHRCHTYHGTSNGDMLKLPAAFLSVKNVGSVRIVRHNGDDVEWLRGVPANANFTSILDCSNMSRTH
jgi:hypothetical protein